MPLSKHSAGNLVRNTNKKFQMRRHKDDYDGKSGFFVDSNYERNYVENKYGKDSSAVEFLDFVHGHGFQLFLGILLVIDVCVIVTELVLEAHKPQCHVIEEQCLCECADHTSMCLDGSVVEPHCHHHPEWVDKLHKALLGTSIAILSVFELELFSIFCVVRSLFFHNFWYMLDLLIVTVSLVIEVLIYKHILVYEESEIGLLVFIRLWRFVRIGHGIYVDTHEFEHVKIERMEHEIEELREFKKEVELQGKGQLTSSTNGTGNEIGTI